MYKRQGDVSVDIVPNDCCEHEENGDSCGILESGISEELQDVSESLSKPMVTTMAAMFEICLDRICWSPFIVNKGCIFTYCNDRLKGVLRSVPSTIFEYVLELRIMDLASFLQSSMEYSSSIEDDEDLCPYCGYWNPTVSESLSNSNEPDPRKCPSGVDDSGPDHRRCPSGVDESGTTQRNLAVSESLGNSNESLCPNGGYKALCPNGGHKAAMKMLSEPLEPSDDSKNLLQDDFDLIADSGAKSHGVPGPEGTNIDPGSLRKSHTKVQVVGARKFSCNYRGRKTVPIVNSKKQNLTMDDVLIIPGGESYILSVSRMDLKDYRIVIESGVMTFFPPSSSNSPYFVAILNKRDGLYHVVHGSKAEKYFGSLEKKYDFATTRGEEQEMPPEALRVAAKFLARIKRPDGKPLTIWEPFRARDRAVDFWISLGYNVITPTYLDFFHPLGPKHGKDYDFMITCPPFKLNSHVLKRIAFEPQCMIFMPTSVICAKSFETYDSQLLILKEGVKFIMPNGEQHSNNHPSRFFWLCRGLHFPDSVLYTDYTTKLLNFNSLNSRQKRQYGEFKPAMRPVPVVGGRVSSKRSIATPRAKTESLLAEKEAGNKSGKWKRRHRIRLQSKPDGLKAIDFMHRRCGHASEAYLRKHFSFPKGETLSFCDACHVAKGHRHSFRNTNQKEYFFMNEVYSNLCGPMGIRSYHHSLYFMIVMEIETRMSWVYFLKTKDQAYDAMEHWLAKAKNATGVHPITILTDGGELDSKRMKSMCDEKGIKYITTAPYASNQNPFVERKNRTVQESALAMLAQGGCPRFFWEQAVSYAVYLQNRTAHKGLKWKSPISRFEGSDNNAHFRYARTFGCEAWAYNTKAQKLSQ